LSAYSAAAWSVMLVASRARRSRSALTLPSSSWPRKQSARFFSARRAACGPGRAPLTRALGHAQALAMPGA